MAEPNSPPTPNTLLTRLNSTTTTHPLSILTLAEPILSSQSNETTLAARDFSTSTASQSQHQDAPSSTSTITHFTPSTLTADLQHYRDLFSKLRFSYLEQITKEKYLRSIVGSPPLLVTPKDNADLEQKLQGMKGELKAKKRETDELVAELETLAQKVAGLWEGVEAGKRELGKLPGEVEGLRGEVEGLREEVGRRQRELNGGAEGADGSVEGGDGERYQTFTLEATQLAISEQQSRKAEIDKEIAELERRLPGKVRECERVERELEEMERRREEVTRQAREVRRIREEGGRDTVGERGRWYRAQEGVLGGLLRT